VLGFAENLPALGWKVGVVAPRSIPWEDNDEGLMGRVPPETAVYRTEYPSGRLAWPLRKIDGFAAWLPTAIRACRRAIREFQPQVVVTSGPPHCVHFVGWFLGAAYGLPWAADFRDPWHAGQFLNADWIRSRVGPVAERFILMRADAIIVNAPNAGRAVTERFPELSQKVHCVTNGFDPAPFTSIQRQASGRYVIAHTGELYAGRDPRPFLDAVKQVMESNPTFAERCEVQFAGKVNLDQIDLVKEIESRQLSRQVTLLGSVPYAESLQRMVNADLLLLIDSPNRTVGVPAKAYEYIGANRPILALARPDSDVQWALQTSGRPYRVAPLDNVSAIANALEECFASGDLQCSQECLSVFSRASTAKALGRILTDCVDGRRTSLQVEGSSSPAAVACRARAGTAP
jgi:hypothetical protein